MSLSLVPAVGETVGETVDAVLVGCVEVSESCVPGLTWVSLEPSGLLVGATFELLPDVVAGASDVIALVADVSVVSPSVASLGWSEQAVSIRLAAHATLEMRHVSLER